MPALKRGCKHVGQVGGASDLLVTVFSIFQLLADGKTGWMFRDWFFEK